MKSDPTQQDVPGRLLGRTGIRVPILGFGTAAAGTRLGLRDAVRLYEEALDQGINYFDTAPGFAGYGKAQEQLGYLLRERRRDVFLVTKCFEPDGERALKLLERSLKELQTDHADLVYVHSLGHDKMDPRVVFDRRGVYPALVKAKADGLTRFVGISGHNRPGRFAAAIERVEIDVLMTAVNFADQHTYNFEERVWRRAVELKIGMVAMKVFGGQQQPAPRSLSHCMMPPPYLDAAFRYALSLPQVACAVVGMATHEELRHNLHRARTFTPLSRSEVLRLRDAGEPLAQRWGPHFGAVV